MIATERRPLSLFLTYGLAALICAILLFMLMRATEQFAWWYVRTIELAS